MKLLRFLLFFNAISAFCQNPNRTFISIQKTNEFVKIAVSDGNYEIRAYSDKIVETSFFPSNIRTKEPSHAVENMPNVSRNFKLIQGKDQCKLVNHDFVVQIQKNPFQISYFYKGKLVTSEKIGYEKSPEFEKISFNLTNDEILFGGGARALGMNRRGNRLQLYNRAHYGYEERSELMNYTMPLVISSRLYAIHFDNPEIGFLDLDSKKDNSLIYETSGGRKTYQVIVGDDWKDLVENETALLGRQPMPPRWMFGNFASRFGYHSQAEAEKVVEKFRKDSIPLDAIIFDLYWFGKEIQGTLGNLEFYKDSFPNPQKMITDFKAKNVKTVLITEPFILTTSKKWEEAKQKNLLGTDSTGKPLTYNFYFGNTGLLDVFQPNVQDWFWNEYKKYISMGVKGFWGDLGEPEVHPSAMFHGKLKADQVHNIYGHQWAKLLADGYKKDFPNERPFTLMRSGYSGTQRYGIIPWSGDVNRTWGGLKPQMEISLQMGLQGVSYMHSDLGGFAGANDDPELYLRWLQYGVFQPVFRPHAQEEVASEPIYKDAKTKELAKQAIELRYQLLPYNYTLAFINHTKGTPLMRPVFMEDSLANWSLNSSKQYFWGEAFMVCPITSKVDTAELGLDRFIFPKGVWFDFHSGKVVDKNIGFPGKDKKGVLTKRDLTKIPVFVKSGSFIPMSEKIQSTDEFIPNKVSVHFYFDSTLTESSGLWYDDDGLTSEAFEKKIYEKVDFKFQKNKKNSIITIKKTVGKAYQSKIQSFNLIIHFDKQAPKNIVIDKQIFPATQYLKNNCLEIPINFKSTECKITFVD